MRVATLPGPPTIPSTGISIHATHAGGDSFRAMPLSLTTISIHATHAGGDWTFFSLIMVPRYFNPRHPCGWRRILHFLFCSAYYFNPRHPCGWRRRMIKMTHRREVFQSTPPMRVATRICGLARTCPFHFNPRHPCGWRLYVDSMDSVRTTFQSTPPMRVATPPMQSHAASVIFQSTPPMRVATDNQTPLNPCDVFQSTPPMRVATLVPTSLRPLLRISIHATHAGGDWTYWRNGRTSWNFNPRHPCGWRLRTPHEPQRRWYFNPRHPCGWRRHNQGVREG